MLAAVVVEAALNGTLGKNRSFDLLSVVREYLPTLTYLWYLWYDRYNTCQLDFLTIL